MPAATKPKPNAKPKPGRKSKLTPELQAEIVDYVRSGAYPQQAAQACGISSTTFFRWMSEGADEGGDPAKREFRESVETAAAQCRVTVEIKVRKEHPVTWLTKGPGKTKAGKPGWTEPIGELPVSGETGEEQPMVSDSVILEKLSGLRSRVLARSAAAAEAAPPAKPTPKPKKRASKKKPATKKAKRPTPRPKSKRPKK